MTGLRLRTVLLGTVLLVGSAGLSGCGEDEPAADYCAAVEEHQADLTRIVGEGGPDALLGALTIFRDLQEQAPGDIRDEWQQVVSRVEALDAALRDAGVDPTTYDHEDPPADLSSEERTAIEAAARDLAAPATTAAVSGLEQQARDVCKTPLVL